MSDPHTEIEYRILRRVSAVPDHSAGMKGLKPAIDRLVKAGLLRRFPMAGSKKPVLVGITEKGRARFAELQQARAA